MKLPHWLTTAVLTTLVRLPLVALLYPGRDEAAYAYWSRNPEPGYALLLQGYLWFFSLFSSSHIFTLRVPALLLGLIALILYDKLLQERRCTEHSRFLALTIFAFCPWQIYTGSIIHPDALQFIVLLLFLLSFKKQNELALAVFAGLAVLAKPSGMIILFFALFLFLIWPAPGRRSRFVLAAMAVLIASPALINLNLTMVNAIAAYGVLGASMPPVVAVIMGMGPTLLLGGPLLPVMAWGGIRIHFEKGWCRREIEFDDVVFGLGIAFLIIFGGAAVFRGQIKGNWLLPALFLLWPRALPMLKPKILQLLALLTVLSGLGTVGLFCNPDLVARIESRFSTLASSYVFQRGQREDNFPGVTTWSERLLEYNSIKPFGEKILKLWKNAQDQRGRPRWIISDDYGLAAQLALEWGGDTKMIVPDDGIFYRSMPPDHIDKLEGGVIIVGVYKKPNAIWHRMKATSRLGTMQHPVTKVSLYLASSNGKLTAPNPKMEEIAK